MGRGLKLRLRISKVHVNPAVSWERAEMEKGHEGMTLSEHFLPYNIPHNRKQTIVQESFNDTLACDDSHIKELNSLESKGQFI